MEAMPLNIILTKHTKKAMVSLPFAIEEPGTVVAGMDCRASAVIVAIIVQFVFLNDHIPVAGDCIHVFAIFLRGPRKMRGQQVLG